MIMKKINRPYNEKDVYNYLLETYENSTSWTSMVLKDKSILFINNKPTEFLINQVKQYHECGYSYNELMLYICAYYWLYKCWNVDVIGLSFLPLERVNNENKTDEEDEFIESHPQIKSLLPYLYEKQQEFINVEVEKFMETVNKKTMSKSEINNEN